MFAKGIVYTSGDTFNTQPGSGQLCLRLHFLFAQSLKSSRGESFGLTSWSYFSWSCGWPWACPKLYKFKWPSNFQEYVRAFQNPLWTYFPAYLLKRRAFCLLFDPQVIRYPQFRSVQSLSCVQLFATHGLQHTRLPWPSPSPGASSNLCP